MADEVKNVIRFDAQTAEAEAKIDAFAAKQMHTAQLIAESARASGASADQASRAVQQWNISADIAGKAVAEAFGTAAAGAEAAAIATGRSVVVTTEAERVARLHAKALAEVADARAKAVGLATTATAAVAAETGAVTANTAAHVANTVARGVDLGLMNRYTSALRTLSNSFSRTTAQAFNLTNASGRLALASGVTAGSVTSLITPVTVAGAAFAALGIGAFEAAEKTAHYQEKIGDLALATGISTEHLSGMALAARSVGVDLSVVERSLTMLARHLGDTSAAGDKAHATLKALGIETTNANEAVVKLIEAFGKAKPGSIAMAESVNLFRRAIQGGGEDTIKFLHAVEAMPGGLKAWEDRAKALGLLVGTNNVIAARAFLSEQREMRIQFNSLVLLIGTKVMPYLTDLGASLLNVGKLAAAGWNMFRLSTDLVFIPLENIYRVIMGIRAAMKGHRAEALEWGKAILKSVKEPYDQVKAIRQSFKDFSDGLVETFKNIDQLATSMSSMGGKDLPELTAKTKSAATANDELATALSRANAQTTALLESTETAQERIYRTYEEGLAAADRAIAKDTQLFNQKKISLAEYEKRLQEYADLRMELELNLEIELADLTEKERQRQIKAADAILAAMMRQSEGAEKRANDYIAKLKDETEADLDAAAARQQGAVAVVAAETRKMLAKEQEVFKNKIADAKILKDDALVAEMQKQFADRTVAAWVLASEKEVEAAKKVASEVRKAYDDEARSLARLETPMAQHLGRLQEQFKRVQQYKQAVMEKVAQERQDAQALRDQAAALRVLITQTADLTEKIKLETQAKRLDKEATDESADADKREAQAKQMSKMADIDATEQMVSNILTTMGYKKQAAYVDMVMQLADAYAAFAMYDYWAGAQHLLSAAEYAIVAGQSASMPGAGAGGGGGGGTAQAPAGALSPAQQAALLAPGAGGRYAAQPPTAPITVHLNFQGPFYGGTTGLNQLAADLTRAVMTRDVKLVASHSVSPSPISHGRV
jgi:hypothetical protein